MPRALIYCRISRDPGHDELGVRRQEADCRALCETHGLDVVDVLVDDDRSAYSGKRRPGYEAMKAALVDRSIDVVVAWHPDRITRHPRELEDLIDLLNVSGATVRTVQAGEYDLGTATGKMAARIVGAVARHESEHKSARLRRKHVELAEAGKLAGGGRRPFGYEADRVTVRADEAAEIRDLVARVFDGETLRGLVRDLERRRVASSGGGRWTVGSLGKMLCSPRLAGLRAHETVGERVAVWEPILSPAEHRRLGALLRGSGAPPRRARYLLTGLVFCTCGGRMTGQPKAGVRDYRCMVDKGGCGKRSVKADPLEELVVDAVLARLDGVRLATVPEGGPDVAALLADLDVRLAELGEMWAAGEIDRGGWRMAKRRLDAERAALVSRLDGEVRWSAMAGVCSSGDVRSAWGLLDADRRRLVLDELVERIEIAPGVRGRARFDPERVRVTWLA